MARVRVPVDDEDMSVSERAAKLLGDERLVAPAPARERKVIPRPHFVTLVAAVISLVVIVLFVVLLQNRNSLQNRLDELSKQSSSEQDQSANELAKLQAELGNFMELPSNETPTLATVSDVEKVKDQTFFKNAQNGDKVLLYSTSGKAILYRPNTKKVIEVAQINSSQQTKQP